MAEGPGGSGVEDLLALDRDVARGVARLGQWLKAVAVDPDSAAAEEPLDAVRRVAGMSTWAALERLDVTDADRPLRDALRQWVYFLMQSRIARAEDVAWARAAAETTLVDRGETRSSVAWREAWRAVTAARTAREARPWIDAATALAPALAAASVRRAARRVEVGRRLGLAHPSAPLVGVAHAVLRATASRFLDSTDDLWAMAFRDVLREGGGVEAVVVAALARDAGHGWPARLTPTSLRDLVPCAFDGRTFEAPALPPARGAASFARALQALGYAVRAARPPASVPFVLAREPGFVAAHRLGFAVGSLPTDRAFCVRALGLGSRIAAAQARSLARTALFEARLGAVRLLLGDETNPAPRDLFDETTARLFGRSADPRLRGAWPGARDDEPARWLALLETVRFVGGLRDRFDADWFRNPRAWSHLRGSSLAREPADEAAARAGVDDLTRAFEGALG